MRTFGLIALILALGSAPARAEFRAAAAARVVTPDPLLPSSAGGPGRPVKEKLGELEARVLVLDDGATKIAFVSEPFLGFPAGLCKRIYAKVKDIPAEHILISATHTHAAPDPYGFPSFGKGVDIKYLESVCEKTADAINEAVGKLQPAQLKIAVGKAEGKIAYNYYAPQLYDPRCHVMQAIGADGKAIGTMVNYAIHPEILIDQPVCSPDLVGPLYDRIAQMGGGIGVFMNGAQGGMITADNRGEGGAKDREDWDECVRIGTLLGDEALRIVAGAAPQADPKIATASKMVKFPLPSNPMWKMISKSPVGYTFNDDNSVSARIDAMNVGDAQILTIPGEAFPNIGFYLKKKMRGKHNFLFGLTNDAYGYIMTKVDYMSFERYKYCSETSLGEMTGEILIEEGLKLCESLPDPKPAPAPAAPAAAGK